MNQDNWHISPSNHGLCRCGLNCNSPETNHSTLNPAILGPLTPLILWQLGLVLHQPCKNKRILDFCKAKVAICNMRPLWAVPLSILPVHFEYKFQNTKLSFSVQFFIKEWSLHQTLLCLVRRLGMLSLLLTHRLQASHQCRKHIFIKVQLSCKFISLY